METNVQHTTFRKYSLAFSKHNFSTKIGERVSYASYTTNITSVFTVCHQAWGTAFVVEFRHIPEHEPWMKGAQWAASSQCTWRRQRPQQYPLTLVPLISHCTFLLLFSLHFSHVLSYMISLEPDKKPSGGFCSWGHRPGSVSGLQLLIIL